MTRRELVKTTVGALFGVSAIPAALEKPPLPRVLTIDDLFAAESVWMRELYRGRRMVKGWWQSLPKQA